MNQKDRIIFLSAIVAIITIFYFIATFLIIPDIKRSSQIQEDIKRVEASIKNLSNIEKNLKDIYLSLNSYSQYLKSFNEGIDKEDLKNLFLLFSKELKVDKIFEEEREDILVSSYVVDMKISSPVKFYNLIEYIEKNSLPLKVDYPIIFEKDKNLIDIKFTTVAYRL